MHRMDRHMFKRQTAEAADDQLAYWLSRPLTERLSAAFFLNAIAWGHSRTAAPHLRRDLFNARKRMQNETFYQDFLEFIQALNDHEVEYVLVGGYAVILHGYPRTTGDLDIWVRPSRDNYERLAAAFRQFGMPVFDMTLENFLDTSRFDVFTFGAPPVSIDLMTMVKGLTFDEVLIRAERIDLGQGLFVRTISLPDLLAAKRASGRNKDFNDIRHLSRERDDPDSSGDGN